METQASGSSRGRRLAIELAVGAALGFAASSFFGPAIIGWWYEPPIKDAFSCASSVRSALAQFVMMQLVCAAIFGVIAMALSHILRRKRAKAAAVAP